MMLVRLLDLLRITFKFRNISDNESREELSICSPSSPKAMLENALNCSFFSGLVEIVQF